MLANTRYLLVRLCLKTKRNGLWRCRKPLRNLAPLSLLRAKLTYICDAERVKLNFTGNPGMTVGGTGDVLSGIVSGLMAQHVDPFEAAVAGAFVNGAAGDFAAG